MSSVVSTTIDSYALHRLVEKRCIKAHVLMVGSDEEPPSLTKPEHRQHLRATIK